MDRSSKTDEGKGKSEPPNDPNLDAGKEHEMVSNMSQPHIVLPAVTVQCRNTK